MQQNKFIKKLEKKAKAILTSLTTENLINESTIKEFSPEELFYQGLVYTKNNFYNDLNEELLKSFEDYKENIDPIVFYENYISNIFKNLYNNYIEKTFNIKINKRIELNEKNDEKFKELKMYIKKDNIEILSSSDLFYIYKNDDVINNKKYFNKTLNQIKILFPENLINKNYSDYLYVTIVDKDLVKSINNKNGVNFHDKGSIRAYLDTTNNILIPDLKTCEYNNNYNNWKKSNITDLSKIIKIEEVNYTDFKINEYLKDSALFIVNNEKSQNINYIDSNKDLEKVDIKFENLLYPLPNNKIFSLSFMDVINEDILFSFIKYYNTGDILEEQVSIKEIGDFKVLYNTKENKEVQTLNEFIFLENYKSETLYFPQNILLLETKEGKSYSSLLDIPEMHYYQNDYNILTLLPKNNEFQKNIIRVNFFIKKYDKEIRNKLKKDFYIISEEPLLFKPDFHKLKKYNQFIKIEDMTEENFKNIYKFMIKNIPEEIISKMEDNNKEYLNNIILVENYEISNF
jgi:hypothetical protein